VDELQRVMAEMSSDYARTLRDRMTLVESLWGKVSSGAPAGDELLRAVHSIAGGAATFGMPEVGEAAEVLEEALRSGWDSSRTGEAVARLLRVAGAAASGISGPSQG
jgi:HPt (histidine-containing phosphotransfer) domain-containing protein